MRIFRNQFLRSSGLAMCGNLASSSNLKGVFPPIVTPFSKNESIDFDMLKKNFEVWKTKGFEGYTVLGSNGEFQYMTIDEKVALVKAVKEMEPKKTLIVGAGCESTAMTVDCTMKLADAGGTVALVYSPCFYRGSMTGAAFVKHYTAVADKSPIPVLLYNVPANTGIDIPLDVITQLAEHENIIGIKESGGNVVRIGHIANKTRHLNFQILAGSASFMKAAYSVGATGTVAALANVMGEEVVKLHNMLMEGEECLDLQYKLIAPNTAVTAGFGIAGLKFVCDNVGLYGGPCRSPIQPLSQEQRVKLAAVMCEAGVECSVEDSI